MNLKICYTKTQACKGLPPYILRAKNHTRHWDDTLGSIQNICVILIHVIIASLVLIQTS